jgi:hypothetical protein
MDTNYLVLSDLVMRYCYYNFTMRIFISKNYSIL